MLYSFFHQKNKNSAAHATAGFTLVETLVAVSILVLAVTGAFTAAQNGISSATYAKDQVVAFYLAAEGVEEIRNLRDTNGLTGANWMNNIAINGAQCAFGNACTVDPSNGDVLATCPSNDPTTCPVLGLDPVSGFYGYNSGWPASIFRRGIVLTQINAHEVQVLVSIDWKNGAIPHKFEVRENIFDWQS